MPSQDTRPDTGSNSRKSILARRPIFDSVRSILRRGFRTSEVQAIDGAIDDAITAGIDRTLPKTVNGDSTANAGIEGDGKTALDSVSGVSGPQAGARPAPTTIGPAGIALIKRFEGCARLRRDRLVAAYPDPGTGGDPWTIGWGATGADDSDGAASGARIGPGTVWTQAQCDARLARDLVRYALGVARSIGDAPTTQGQFDAMVSFHYNTGAIARATLTKKHIAGDHAGAAAEFARWNRAGGRVLKGLVRRRADETPRK